MLSILIQRRRIVTGLMLATVLQLHSTMAENRMQLKKSSDNSITIEMTNADPIAGFQFSVQGRGGIVWGTYEGSERAGAAGLAVYQYLKNDSTLNVVILAPFRSALPSGQGAIGTIGFTLRSGAAADTISAFLTGLVICDANANYLDVSAERLVWNRREDQESRPATFTLEQNYPNPFNPSTTISYKLDKPANVRLVVYDVAGRLINTLLSQVQNEGRYSVQWNASDNRGTKLASGMYFARLQVDGQVAIKKMILTK
ncbi:T9SS C-terminal target domain-containing protein [bacterium]|nr:MAG: T9SS C-terminal target domain-containing protein [bacterium]